jgi:pimeloyl-ACP methyl ester carboxylesterase
VPDDLGCVPAEEAARQLVAIMSSGDRTGDLGRIDCPTLVIHGEADVLVDPSGGRATAAAIPGAELMTLPGAGHHIPQEIFDPLADRIAAHLHPNDVRHTG